MASGTLSQNEIDSLLNRPGALKGQTGAVKQDAQLYDFRRPHRVSKERLRTLEAMYEQLVKSLEGWLMGRVRGQVELRLQSVEQFTFGEFTLSLNTPCSSYIFDIYDSDGHSGIIDFGGEFAAFLVDRLFGGSGKSHTPNRALTPIERMAVKVVADRIVTQLQEAWQDHVPLEMAITGFESMPEILRGASGDDSVLVATIEAIAGDQSSLMLICLPFAVLEAFFASTRDKRLSGTTPKERDENRELAETALRATRIPVSARLPEFRLPLRDLAQLRVGGVLMTGIGTDSELDIRVNDQPRFRGTPGRAGRRLAVRINEDLMGDMPAEPSTSRTNP